MATRWSNYIPNKATFTEKELSDQSGKVFIVTGGSGGVGKQLASILYQRNGKVYVAARNQEKAEGAIEDIKKEHPSSKGELVFLRLQLDDLTTIKASAEEFLSKEKRLDVLFNNAGVMVPPNGSKTVQGYELQLGTNNLGTFLFTKLLRDVAVETARTAPRNSVRIVWVSSSGADLAPKPAIDFDNLDYHKDENHWTKYMRSKAGNAIHSCEFARRNADTGVLSLSLNPGNLRTDLQRHVNFALDLLCEWFLWPAKSGAYTELFAGLSDTIDETNNGGWVAPFGKLENIRKDLEGEEIGKKFWEWSEEQVKQYV